MPVSEDVPAPSSAEEDYSLSKTATADGFWDILRSSMRSQQQICILSSLPRSLFHWAAARCQIEWLHQWCRHLISINPSKEVGTWRLFNIIDRLFDDYHYLSLLYTPKKENSWDKLGIIGGPSIFLVIYPSIFWGHVLPGCRCFFRPCYLLRTGSELGELNAQRLLELLDQRKSQLVMADLNENRLFFYVLFRLFRLSNYPEISWNLMIARK